MSSRTPWGIRFPALSLTAIANELAPTGGPAVDQCIQGKSGGTQQQESQCQCRLQIAPAQVDEGAGQAAEDKYQGISG